MIRLNQLAVIAIVIFTSCTTKSTVSEESTTEQAEATEVETTETIESESPLGNDELKIIGSNIWVRSKPTNGDVVMKLNDGDRCKILDFGHYEIIRGTGHYWYNISFGEQSGWVFGSQTTKEVEDKSFTSTLADLTETLKAKLMEACEKEFADYEGAECIMNGYNELTEADGLQPDEFVIHYSEESAHSHLYKPNKKYDFHFTLFDVISSQSGASGISETDNFLIGFKDGSNIKLSLNEFLGKPQKMVEIAPNEYLLLTFQDYRNILMFYNGSYHVYYINTATETIQRVAGELGQIDGGGHLEESEEGFEYFYKSDYRFDKASPLVLEIDRYKKLKKEDGSWEELSGANTEKFNWDEKNKRFVLQ